MARFAGSRKPSITNYADQGLKSAGYSFGGQAAGNVSLGSIFGGVRDASPNYDDGQLTAAGIRSQERNAVEDAKASAVMAGIDAAKNVHIGEMEKKMYEKQASGAKSGGMMSAIGGIASAALPLLMSDESTKHSINRISDALDVLRSLKPVTFYYREEFSSSPERLHYGFIAQEYKEVMPDATYYDDSIGKLCIDPNELIALLVRANQQLEVRVMRLEAKEALLAV